MLEAYYLERTTQIALMDHKQLLAEKELLEAEIHEQVPANGNAGDPAYASWLGQVNGRLTELEANENGPAWLIEKEDLKHPGCTTSLCLGCLERGKKGIISLEWTTPQFALRFCRKQDALLAAMVMVPDVKVIACEHMWESDPKAPYLTQVSLKVTASYNPKYGDEKPCKCGHPYHRHFDSYEENAPVGCKYCCCDTFKEDTGTTKFAPKDEGSKGKWVFERQSGYAGFKCVKCAVWLHADHTLVCDCDKNQPYITVKCPAGKTIDYNPRYGDDRVCKCGHSYRRHFGDDFGVTYIDDVDLQTGCRDCSCRVFEERK